MMVDFVKSFQQGLTSAEIAQNAKEEIQSVFSELNRQLHSATDGKIKIEIGVQGVTWVQSNWFITARNPLIPGSEIKKLANWSQHPTGYPCTITVGNIEYVCEDKEALEEAIASMLQNPKVGEYLQSLL
jgi:hypothetical protein